MRKLKRNQRIIYNDKMSYYGIRPWLELQERCCLIFWTEVASVMLPKNFTYDCSEEVKNNLIEDLWKDYDRQTINKKKQTELETKKRNFKKCLKKFIKK